MPRLQPPIPLALACATVGVLTGFGLFNSVVLFPLIFAAVCLLLGLLSLWRDQPRQAIPLRAGALLLGVAIVAGGWTYQRHVVEQSLIAGRDRVLAEMRGQTVPALTGLQPINTDQADWDASASLTAPATVVTFWARWCTPCEKEMPELESLYRQHRDRGLRVVAVTPYDNPDDDEKRRSDFEKARKFLEKRDLTYPSAITGDPEVFRAYQAPSVPRTILVDDQGRVVDYAISLDSSRALMSRAVEMLGPGEAG